MFFIISKLVYGFLMPISIVLILFALSYIAKTKRIRTYARNIGFGFLIVFTNPFFASIAISSWEVDPVSYEALETKYKYGVVLTGITDPLKVPYDRIHFNKGADRIVHTLELYRKGIIENIIISGGSGSLLHQDVSESKDLRSFLLMAGIPEANILIETKSRNTYENGLFVKELLENIKHREKVLLITSAFHMRRSEACFEKMKVQFDPFPTDYYGRPIELTPDDFIIPNATSLKEWTIIIKEWIGYVAYWFAGYI